MISSGMSIQSIESGQYMPVAKFRPVQHGPNCVLEKAVLCIYAGLVGRAAVVMIEILEAPTSWNSKVPPSIPPPSRKKFQTGLN